MDFQGTFATTAPIEKVWDTFIDPRNLAPCMPDLQLLEVYDPTHFRAVVKAGVSFIKGKFDFEVRIVEQDRLKRARLQAHGRGRGSAVDVDSTVVLIKTVRGTEMRWQAEARLVGKLAQVGSRLIESTADKKVNEFFGCVEGPDAESHGVTGASVGLIVRWAR
ncbi:MAG: carbon monoxide dehydrogenase subunit G [Thermoplasmata archaeon]|nr:carbon monoxide dehydrogenase subunit G [Thermoplasmata archaeon]